MRTTAFLVLALALAMIAGGLVMGFGSMASWNGRNTLVAVPLEGATARDVAFAGRHGRRYWVGVQAQIAREGLTEKDDLLTVPFKMPLVLALRDDTGTDLLTATGWFDPEEPPTALFGHARGGLAGQPILAERLLGPHPVQASRELHALAEVGPDRTGIVHVSSLRLVVYDDAVPPALAAPFAVAGVGAVAGVVGLGLLVASLFRGRTKPTARAA